MIQKGESKGYKNQPLHLAKWTLTNFPFIVSPKILPESCPLSFRLDLVSAKTTLEYPQDRWGKNNLSSSLSLCLSLTASLSFFIFLSIYFSNCPSLCLLLFLSFFLSTLSLFPYLCCNLSLSLSTHMDCLVLFRDGNRSWKALLVWADNCLNQGDQKTNFSPLI